MSSTMKYYDYCREQKIPHFPIRLWLKPTGETLSDGSVKVDKIICSECFGTVGNVYDYYGEELGKYLCEHNLTKKNIIELQNNPEFGIRRIIPKMKDFDMPKKLLKQYIKCKWRGYKNGNDQKYTHFAVDTKRIGVVDIDCELPTDSPFLALMTKFPFKKSNTKAFGRHIIFDRQDIPHSSRTTDKLDKKWGICKNGEAGVEFLNGIWEWAKLSDVIENPDADLTPEDWLKQEIIKLISNNHRNNNSIQSSMNGGGETKTSEPTTSPPPPPVVEGIPQLPPNALEALIENINNYPVDKLCGVQNWGGIVACWSLSKNETVFNILHEACKRPGTNYGGEQPIRDVWNAGVPPHDYQRYAFGPTGFFSYWCIKKAKPFPWKKFMEQEDRMVQERFINNHSHNFILNTDYRREDTRLCYFDEQSKLWKHDPKTGIGKSIIHHLLMGSERLYWETEMDASIEAMDDNELDDDGQQQPNSFKEAATKFKIKHLNKYNSTGGWLGGTIRNIYNMLLYNTDLRQEVQFNLMPNTKHLFQFRNGAFNFKTAELEERTRDMYISSDGVLKYDFPEDETDDDYHEEMKVIEDMITKCLPNTGEREAWCSWKGYCMTGEISGQMFFIYLGAGAGGGKSIVGCEMFRDAFPVYVKLLGKDAVVDKAKDDKSLSGLVNKAFRMCYCEELVELGLKIKELTQKTTTVKPLYMEEIELIIQFKMEGLCNAVPVTKCDEGVLRRAHQIEWNSKFVDEACDVDESEHIYLKDPNLGDKFKNEIRYKIALFRYFARYAKNFYDSGVNRWKKQFEGMRQAFQDTNQDDDALAEFVKCFEKSDDEDDVISKSQMLEHLYNETGDEFIKTDANGNNKYKKFSNIRNEFKKHRYKYESQMRISGQKGIFTYIKFVGDGGNESD